MRAEKAGFGQLPARVHKCEPARSASGFGWYVHLPLDFQVVFDGVDCIISFDEGENYLPLTELWYPNFADRFNALVPENCRGYAPPYVVMTEDHGILQIWTGYIVRTQPDYSVWVRSPVNYLAQTSGYYHLEGIIRDRPLDRPSVQQHQVVAYRCANTLPYPTTIPAASAYPS